MSIAPTQIHLAVSAPKATGSDCSNCMATWKVETKTDNDKRQFYLWKARAMH